MSRDVAVPDRLPILSQGKHRSPKKGACFMELASYLAGERWSDHPSCTHPLLAAVARSVNDRVSDTGRRRLAPLIPSVVGLTTDDPHVIVRIALRCARTALPVVSAERQRAMAVAVLACERELDRLDNREPGTLEDESHRALDFVPETAQWARRFAAGQRSSAAAFRRHAAPNIVNGATEGIARACIADPDQLLYDLLVGCIADTRAWIRTEPVEPTPTKWDELATLTKAR